MVADSKNYNFEVSALDCNGGGITNYFFFFIGSVLILVVKGSFVPDH